MKSREEVRHSGREWNGVRWNVLVGDCVMTCLEGKGVGARVGRMVVVLAWTVEPGYNGYTLGTVLPGCYREVTCL